MASASIQGSLQAPILLNALALKEELLDGFPNENPHFAPGLGEPRAPGQSSTTLGGTTAEDKGHGEAREIP